MPSCGNTMLGDDSVVESPSIYVGTCPCEGGTQAVSLMKRLPSSRCLLCSLLLCAGLLACRLCNCIKYHVIISIKASNSLCVISIVQQADGRSCCWYPERFNTQNEIKHKKPVVQHFYTFFTPSLILQLPCQMSK